MNKKNIIISILVIMIVGLILYPLIAKFTIKNMAKEFLQEKGYVEKDIKNIKVEHSYLNRILSYDEWSILVEFTSLPDIEYSFTKKDGKILFRGLFDSSKSKAELKELEDKYENGNLRS